MKTILKTQRPGLAFIVILIAAAGSLSWAQSPAVHQERNLAKIDETPLLMRAKLANTQKVIEGLVTENFGLVGEGAREMKRIAEAAHWPQAVDEVYQHHSVNFRMQCEKLMDQARRKDLQAAHYTYLHLSTSCIDCHSYVRHRFKIERNELGGPVQLIPTRWEGEVKNKLPPQPDDDDGIGN